MSACLLCKQRCSRAEFPNKPAIADGPSLHTGRKVECKPHSSNSSTTGSETLPSTYPRFRHVVSPRSSTFSFKHSQKGCSICPVSCRNDSDDMRGSISGTKGPLKREHPSFYFLLGILDCLIATLVVGPAVVGYWRSVWLLSEFYIFPDNPVVSDIISTVLGNVGHLIFTFSQGFFKKHLNPSRNKPIFYILSRLYTALFAIVCVNWWRGPWNLLDWYTGTDVTSVATITAVSVAALAVMRTLRNVSAPPCAVMLDTVEGYFEVVTMFRVVSDVCACLIG